MVLMTQTSKARALQVDGCIFRTIRKRDGLALEMTLKMITKVTWGVGWGGIDEGCLRWTPACLACVGRGCEPICLFKANVEHLLYVPGTVFCAGDLCV